MDITPELAGSLVLIIGAISTAAVAIIKAIKDNSAAAAHQFDQAATRREQIGKAIIDPAETMLPPKEQQS